MQGSRLFVYGTPADPDRNDNLVSVPATRYVARASPGIPQSKAHMAVLATWAPEDAVLGAVAPRALAAAAGTCLVVDLDPLKPAPADRPSLADLVSDGPRAADLAPRRRGVAILAGGGVTWEDAADLVAVFGRTWPAVVVACPFGPTRPAMSGVVPVLLDTRHRRSPLLAGAAVLQTVGRSLRRTAPEVVRLPPVARSSIDRLLDGRMEGPSRWMRAWKTVWRLRWP